MDKVGLKIKGEDQIPRFVDFEKNANVIFFKVQYSTWRHPKAAEHDVNLNYFQLGLQ